MKATKQITIKQPIEFSGIGLHSGHLISVKILPAPIDTGIVFRILDQLGQFTEIPARYQYVGALSYNTSLSGFGVQIQTVEHLLSALHGFEIDNVYIELSHGEVPVMDGSAAPFVFLLSEAGVTEQSALKSTMRLTDTVRIEADGSWIEASPTNSLQLSIDYSIDFDHPSIGKMRYQYKGDARNFAYAIAPARTFGFLKEVEYLRQKGLIKGASMANAVVLDDFRVISGSLRFKDEFIRHKILDFWGDIMLLGRPLAAHVRAHKAGHRIHAMLVEKLLMAPGLLEPVVACSVESKISAIPAFATSSLK